MSLTTSSVCILDATGRIVREAKVASEPEALVAYLAGCLTSPDAGHGYRPPMGCPAQPWCRGGRQPTSRWERGGLDAERVPHSLRRMPCACGDSAASSIAADASMRPRCVQHSGAIPGTRGKPPTPRSPRARWDRCRHGDQLCIPPLVRRLHCWSRSARARGKARIPGRRQAYEAASRSRNNREVWLNPESARSRPGK